MAGHATESADTFSPYVAYTQPSSHLGMGGSLGKLQHGGGLYQTPTLARSICAVECIASVDVFVHNGATQSSGAATGHQTRTMDVCNQYTLPHGVSVDMRQESGGVDIMWSFSETTPLLFAIGCIHSTCMRTCHVMNIYIQYAYVAAESWTC